METLKKLGIKDIVIILLGLALIISFMFGQKSKTNTHDDEINNLHKNNTLLLLRNDSLMGDNLKKDAVLSILNKKIVDNENKLRATQSEITKLNKRTYEIPIYVEHLSANGVANEFTKYLEIRTKSSSNN